MRKEFFLNNIGLKLVSLILGILIWVYFMGEKGLYPFKKLNPRYTSTKKDIPVCVLQSASKNFKVEIKPAKVDIALTGPYKLVEQSLNFDPIVFVDVSQLTSGTHFLALRTNIINRDKLKIDMSSRRVKVIISVKESIPPLIPLGTEKIHKSSEKEEKDLNLKPQIKPLLEDIQGKEELENKSRKTEDKKI